MHFVCLMFMGLGGIPIEGLGVTRVINCGEQIIRLINMCVFFAVNEYTSPRLPYSIRQYW